MDAKEQVLVSRMKCFC